MKILYLCPDLGIPVLGRKGASVHVRELIGAFARAGHQVTLAAQTLLKSPDDEPARVKARVIQVASAPAITTAAQALKSFNEQLGVASPLPGEVRRIAYNDTLYRELKRRFYRHRPDFIYERASLYAMAGARLAAKFKVPHIIELNAPIGIEQAAYRATSFGELAAAAERWTLTHADTVIVVSSELGKHVRRLGVAAKKIHIMPNGVNLELFCVGRARHSVRAGRQLQPNGAHGVTRPTLGFVGGLRPWHGIEVLPRLLAHLSKRHPDIRLVIAGDGQLRGDLEREFKRRKLTPRVTFTGALLHEDIPRVIRQFDIALAPYPKHDHDFYFSPLKLFEYMACGVAVVASDVGQISEVVRHGKTGLLYPAGNFTALAACCEQLLAKPEQRAVLGTAAAREVAKQFTWDINASRVIKLAEQLQP